MACVVGQKRGRVSASAAAGPEWTEKELDALRRLHIERCMTAPDIAAMLRKPLPEVKIRLAVLVETATTIATARSVPSTTATARTIANAALSLVKPSAQATKSVDTAAKLVNELATTAPASQAPTAFTVDDDVRLLELVSTYGPAWTEFATRHFPGRFSACRLRNRYRTTLEPFISKRFFKSVDECRAALAAEVHCASSNKPSAPLPPRRAAGGLAKHHQRRSGVVVSETPVSTAPSTIADTHTWPSDVFGARGQPHACLPSLPLHTQWDACSKRRPVAALHPQQQQQQQHQHDAQTKLRSPLDNVVAQNVVDTLMAKLDECAAEQARARHDADAVARNVAAAVRNNALDPLHADWTRAVLRGGDDDDAARRTLHALTSSQLEALHLAYLFGGEDAFRSGLRQFDMLPPASLSPSSTTVSIVAENGTCPMWSSVIETPRPSPLSSSSSSPSSSPPPPSSPSSSPSGKCPVNGAVSTLAALIPLHFLLQSLRSCFVGGGGSAGPLVFPFSNINPVYSGGAAGVSAGCPFYASLSKQLRRCSFVIPATICATSLHPATSSTTSHSNGVQFSSSPSMSPAVATPALTVWTPAHEVMMMSAIASSACLYAVLVRRVQLARRTAFVSRRLFFRR